MITIILRVFFTISAMFFGFILFKKKPDTAEAETGTFWTSSIIGGIAYFFDALGIGGFATSTVMLRHFRQVTDKLLPGTLNTICAIPAFAEAIIFISIIQVDYVTLLSMVIAAAIGGWLGAAYVIKLPEQKIRLAISVALFISGSTMIAKQLSLFPAAHSDATGFTGIKLIIAVIASGIIGALSSVGIGFFAPTLSIAYLLGMSAKATFPIMMSGCAVCTAMAGLKFIKKGLYNRKVTLAATWCAVVGVILAAYIVKTLPLTVLNWVVTVVVYYTSVTLFIAYYKTKKFAKDLNIA